MTDPPGTRHALVTGGTTGIGLAVAGALVAAGYRVGVMSREPRSTPFPVDRFSGDVGDADDVKRVSAEVLERYGTVDVLVLAAGVFPDRRPLDQVSTGSWEATLATNLTGPFLMTRALLPALSATSGYVFAVGSVYGSSGLRLGAPYAASKWGLAGLVASLVEEFEEHRVRATLVSPGIVDTSMGASPASTGRLIDPSDVAQTVLWCLGLGPQTLVREVTLERTHVARRDREVQESGPQWFRPGQ